MTITRLTKDGITFGTGQSLNDPGGSAPMYACRAWVNWTGVNGQMNGYGNVGSVSRSSVGYYTVNFTTAMTDANYVIICSCTQGDGNHLSGGTMLFPGTRYGNGSYPSGSWSYTAPTTTACPIGTNWLSSGVPDPTTCYVGIFR